MKRENDMSSPGINLEWVMRKVLTQLELRTCVLRWGRSIYIHFAAMLLEGLYGTTESGSPTYHEQTSTRSCFEAQRVLRANGKHLIIFISSFLCYGVVLHDSFIDLSPGSSLIRCRQSATFRRMCSHSRRQSSQTSATAVLAVAAIHPTLPAGQSV